MVQMDQTMKIKCFFLSLAAMLFLSAVNANAAPPKVNTAADKTQHVRVMNFNPICPAPSEMSDNPPEWVWTNNHEMLEAFSYVTFDIANGGVYLQEYSNGHWVLYYQTNDDGSMDYVWLWMPYI